jgi:hypothetical protein
MKGAKSKGAVKADTKLAVKSKGAEKPAAKGKKGKAGKDPNKPKRAPSAFFVFMHVLTTDSVFLLLFSRDARAAVVLTLLLLLVGC